MRLLLPAAVLAVVFLSAVPVGAQNTTLDTKMEVVATPKLGWDADGFLDPYTENAFWAVDATIEFAANAACAMDSKVTFSVPEPSTHVFANVTPHEVPVKVTPSGTATVQTNVTAFAAAIAPAGAPFLIPLNATLADCPSPVGTQKGLSVTINLTFEVLHRPQISVAVDPVRSHTGQFNYTVQNTGNVPLVVTATVEKNGTQVPATGLLSAVPLDPGEFTSARLEIGPAKDLGTYQLHVEGRFNGPGAENLPFSQFNAELEIDETAGPEPASQKDSPAATPWMFVFAAIIAGFLSRRHA